MSAVLVVCSYMSCLDHVCDAIFCNMCDCFWRAGALCVWCVACCVCVCHQKLKEQVTRLIQIGVGLCRIFQKNTRHPWSQICIAGGWWVFTSHSVSNIVANLFLCCWSTSCKALELQSTSTKRLGDIAKGKRSYRKFPVAKKTLNPTKRGHLHPSNNMRTSTHQDKQVVSMDKTLAKKLCEAGDYGLMDWWTDEISSPFSCFPFSVLFCTYLQDFLGP